MKIVEIKVLRGPNYWSVRRPKLIQMKLDLEELEQRPTNQIEGFRDRLEKTFPSLIEHRCSVGTRGGFFERVEEGTWMGHVIEHIALELQTLAGMDTGFGRTRSTGKEGEYFVVFSYMEEDAGVYAAKAAVRISQALADDSTLNLEEDIQQLREIREETRLGPSTGCIVDEAMKRGIEFYDMIGAERKEQRLFYLKNYWMNKVKNIPKVKIGTSMKSGFGCAIGLVSVEGKKPSELDNFLYTNYKVHTVGIEWENIKGVRITPNVYTTIKNLDVLVEGIEKFASQA